MQDPFIGTWQLNPRKSAFDPNHQPTAGTMVFELDEAGVYLMRATGVCDGKRVAERPQRFVPDGSAQACPDLPDLTTVTTRPDPNTLKSEVRRDDGSIAGEGTYAVSADGRSLTGTVAGFDSQLRRFETRTVWDRQPSE
ncbi:MAG: hypothetical protein QF681_19150 [Vicinamibacterales bacterium]|nr:hypothetical protein [Vicinamibacterales bacterium]